LGLSAVTELDGFRLRAVVQSRELVLSLNSVARRQLCVEQPLDRGFLDGYRAVAEAAKSSFDDVYWTVLAGLGFTALTEYQRGFQWALVEVASLLP
jgi:hypothetical protein